MNGLKSPFIILLILSCSFALAQEDRIDFCYDEDNDIVIDEAFILVEKMPVFNPDECYSPDLPNHTMQACSNSSLEKIRIFPYSGDDNAYVYCTMVIDTLGKCRNIEIVKSDDSNLNNLVIATIKVMPLWHPGMQRGDKVDVKVMIPFLFMSEE